MNSTHKERIIQELKVIGRDAVQYALGKAWPQKAMADRGRPCECFLGYAGAFKDGNIGSGYSRIGVEIREAIGNASFPSWTGIVAELYYETKDQELKAIVEEWLSSSHTEVVNVSTDLPRHIGTTQLWTDPAGDVQSEDQLCAVGHLSSGEREGSSGASGRSGW